VLATPTRQVGAMMEIMANPAEPDTHLAYYLVLVTDVLGQRSRLRELRHLPQSEDERNAVTRVLRDTATFVMLWRKGFHDYFKAWGQPTAFLEQFPENVRAAARDAFSSRITHRHFSDTIIVSVCLYDDGYDGPSVVLSILGTLLAACTMHVISLAAQKPTRGGVDVGLALVLPEGDVYGPALERAAHLEAMIAASPRVVVGEELIQYLAAVASQVTSTQNATIARNVAHLCQKLLFRDQDNMLALDFLGEELHRHGLAEIIAESLPKAYTFVQSARLRAHEEGNQKLAGRYDSLWTYLRSRAHLWGGEIERLANELESK
jgi:hypothetical protein